MCLYRTVCVFNTLLLLYLNAGVQSFVSGSELCIEEDELLSSTARYQFGYSGTVRLQHSTADGSRTAASVSLQCTVTITGQALCRHAIQFSLCSVGPESALQRSPLQDEALSQLTRNGAHFVQRNGSVESIWVESGESESVTNIRRGVINMLRVTKPILDTSATVEKSEDGSVRYVMTMEDVMSQEFRCSHSVVSPLQPLQNMDWLDGLLAAPLTCNYVLQAHHYGQVKCRQSRDLWLPAGEQVTVDVSQELALESVGSSEGAVGEGVEQEGTVEVPTQVTCQHLDTSITSDQTSESVYDRMAALVGSSVPLLTPETPQRFSQLLQTLRDNFSDPLLFSQTCQDCTQLQKEFAASAAGSALLQCGSPVCLSAVTNALRSDQLTVQQLTPLFFSWLWSRSHDEEGLQARYALCDAAAAVTPSSAAWRRCQIALSAELGYRGQHESDIAPVQRQLVELMARAASSAVGNECDGEQLLVIHSLKVLANLGSPALVEDNVQDHLETCVLQSGRDVMVVTEAVRTLDSVSSDIRLQEIVKTIVSDPSHHLLSRQLAYLTLVRRFPTEESYMYCLQMAGQSPHAPMSVFITQHVRALSPEQPGYAASRRALSGLAESHQAPPEDGYNSFRDSSVRQLKLPLWPNSAAQITLSAWRLHGASFLPHMLYVNVSVTGLPRGVQIGPFEMELRGVGMEQLVHRLLSSPQLDQLPAVVEQLVRLYAQLFGGNSFEFGTFSEQIPLLSTTVADWLQQLLDQLQLSDDPAYILEPAAMLTISASGHQLLYFTAAELWDGLSSSESFVDPVFIVGRKLSHTEHIFKPLEARYKVWLPLGVPLDIFSDATLATSAATMFDSRLEVSDNNILENFVGDVNISASAAVSLVSVLQVSLLSKARADFVMNTTVNLPLYLPLSYARSGRVLTINLTKPHREVTVAYLSHGISLTEGSGRLQRAPSDTLPAVNCPPWARYIGLTVCVRSKRSSPAFYHVTAVDAEPWTSVYSVDLWSSARDDGYQFGGSAHLLLQRPAVAAHPVHLIWSFRLKPANYNTQLFSRGQKSNTTLQLLVGDSSVPLWFWYFRHAQTEMGDVLFTEYVTQASNRDQVLVQGAVQSNVSLPWALEDGWRNEVAVDGSFAGQEVKYVRRASTSLSGDADLFLLVQYNTKYESSVVQTILAPEFYDVPSRSAHLRVNLTRRVISDEMMRSVDWRHLLVISTPGLVISGGLDAASSVDSGAALVANLTTSGSTDGRLITYVAATASHIPAVLGDDRVDLWEAMLSAPGRSVVARARLLTTSFGSQTFNGSLETSTGDAGVAHEVVHWGKVSASVSGPGTKADTLDYSAQLELPGDPDDVISLTGDWLGDWPRPLFVRLPWRPFSVQHSCRVSWPRADVTVTSQLWATNSSDEMRVETRLDGRRAAATAGVSLQLFWNRLQPLWNSQLLVESPLVQINNSLIATPSGSGQMLHELSHLSTSSVWELLDLDVQGTLRVDCSDCAVQQRAVDAKLRHKWGRVSLKSLRQVANSTSLPKLQSLDLRVDGKIDFMPSLTCRLKSADDFSLSLDIPSVGVPSQLELQYLSVPPSTWSKKQTRSVDVNLASAGVAPTSGVYVAMETEPHDPSHLAVEFELNPRPWMPLVTAVLHKYKQVATRFWKTLLDPDWAVNRLLAPVIDSQTLAHWIQQLPKTTSSAVSWTFDRLAALVSPWSAVVDPVYVTLNNAQHYTAEMFSKLRGPPKSQTNEGDGSSLPSLASIQDRVRSLIPAAVMQQLVKVFNGAVSSAMARLPFSVHQSAQEGGRTRLEIRDLPPYANLETIWNVSSVLSARLRAPSPLNQLLSWHRQPRVSAAASWTSGAAVALDGRTFRLPDSDRCAQLLLADLEARRFVVLRSQRHLSIVMPDCSVLLDDRGYVSVSRFSNTNRASSVWVSGDWLRVRASTGLRVDVHITCMTAEFLVDVWMLHETTGLLAPHSAGANLSLVESVRRFSVPLIVEDSMQCSGPTADAMSHHMSPAAATSHHVLPAAATSHHVSPAAASQDASCNTAGCQRFTASSHPGERRPSVCGAAATAHPTLWRLHDPSPPLLDSPPTPLYVVYAVSDPAVTTSTLTALSDALRRLLSGFERRTVYFSLLPAAQQLHSLSWTDSASELSMEGRKLPSDDVIRSLQSLLMTSSVFPAHSRRLLILFSDSAETDAASLISLRRMLQRRRLAVHLVTSLRQYADLPISVRGVTADGDVIPADDEQSAHAHALKATPPELGLTALVDDIGGAVWNISLLYGIGGDVTANLLAGRVWHWLSEMGVMHERVVSEYDEVDWKQEHGHDERQKAYQSSSAGSSAVVFISPLSLILALSQLYRLGRL